MPKTYTPDQRDIVAGMLEAVVGLSKNRALRMYNTHFSAKPASDRIAQIHLMRKIIAQSPEEGGAWTGSSTDPLWPEDRYTPAMPDQFVLLGDFNLGVKDPEYSHLVRRDKNECDLVDCWTLAGHEPDEGSTFPGAKPDESQRIDFVFVDQPMWPKIAGSWIDERAQGSDHKPLWVETVKTGIAPDVVSPPRLSRRPVATLSRSLLRSQGHSAMPARPFGNRFTRPARSGLTRRACLRDQ
jgi:endonuclease/exonuclease/phosphatase family metal-dependent hydrolase